MDGGEEEGWGGGVGEDAQRRSCVALSPPQPLAATAKCHQPRKKKKKTKSPLINKRRRECPARGYEEDEECGGALRRCIYRELQMGGYLSNMTVAGRHVCVHIADEVEPMFYSV